MRFLLRRLARIWPSHLVVLSLFAVVVLAAGVAGIQPNQPEWFRWSNLPAQLVLVQSWGFAAGDVLLRASCLV